MSKYKRKLTDEERAYISELSVRHPRLAINAATVLREQSYRIGGRTIFFTPPKAKDDTTLKAKSTPPKKRKRRKMLKMPKTTGKICGLEMLGKKG